jgi:hypothetical protein
MSRGSARRETPGCFLFFRADHRHGHRRENGDRVFFEAFPGLGRMGNPDCREVRVKGA